MNKEKQEFLDNESEELILFIEQEEKLYNQIISIVKNIQRKIKRQVYDHNLAPKLWMYLVNAGAKKYCENDRFCKWYHSFPKEVREYTAQILANNYLAEIKAQNNSMF